MELERAQSPDGRITLTDHDVDLLAEGGIEQNMFKKVRNATCLMILILRSLADK